MATIYLLLGANLGDRLSTIQRAATLIGERVGAVTKGSSVYQTAPWGVEEQPAFLNQALVVETALAPEEVLRHLLDIEHELGRVRYERWGARDIDIDMLYYGHLVMDTARLTLPHPRLHERRFALVPLAEIAPDFVHPVLGVENATLLKQCPDEGEVRLFSE
ncbi:2-amino-4-hydroxy-6-hydroxymethyldihydropteridine diphosphokinase [Telluribacter sp. SYSU D00476]|uniref:2-amino-4-hydroxy-6- hydroxymethyldihydropteridine diphosphokinase n=1 Tax=Telluribacter sp. SYSU D00476 TaxID=2811430 RepID=UPI001FF602CE|nr:2-amino-4-hydroxy-6-hydroxymethyldihydropteridine diphosphokinase [Telluribacter sp. SYSU D00476]